MLEARPFLLRLSIISVGVFFLRLLRKAKCMALSTAPPRTTSSPPPPPPSFPWWLRHRPPGKEESISCQKPNMSWNINGQQCENLPIYNGDDFSPIKKAANDVMKPISRKRPARLVVPTGLDFVDKVKKVDCKTDFEVIKSKDFFLASKKGRRREVMEDRHAAMLDISGDPKQAFFVVIDGHGGHAAADYVAENLGKNILNELQGVERTGNQIEVALRGGYSATDKQFLAQDVNGGACAAGVLLKDGELHAANVGDCKVVLSRKGKAITLTNDHRLDREDERARIENSGGFLHCSNGVWRVNGSLAVSRAFGDLHLKDWIISEPEIVKISLTSDCEFLIVASDGLWDKVSDQEAVDVASYEKNLLESCRKLIDMSTNRGNRDDITVMMINLQNFKTRIA
ncbi:hypothetical protein RD792_000650 [Penstemon davidsonii]|uniref:PPM-type phosphatase domain-containing protein n=2 Tax=Penstemon davidsonii TaxID=160366 RepID=A0ABR0DM02_9LAMI|nr:hypothetical protein RD792_000650 [Penstemon davidsonii]